MYITLFLILISPLNSLLLNKNIISSSVARYNTQLSVAKHNKYVDITEIKESLKLASSLLKPAVYKARSPNQEWYVECLNDPNVSMVFGVGPAGCGKTLFAVISAITALKKGDISKIILTRPIVSVEEELGFLPGDISNKIGSTEAGQGAGGTHGGVDAVGRDIVGARIRHIDKPATWVDDNREGVGPRRHRRENTGHGAEGVDAIDRHIVGTVIRYVDKLAVRVDADRSGISTCWQGATNWR